MNYINKNNNCKFIGFISISDTRTKIWFKSLLCVRYTSVYIRHVTQGQSQFCPQGRFYLMFCRWLESDGKYQISMFWAF
jgi:hypothetical protein